MPRQVDLGLDDLLVGRLAVLPLALEGLGGHLDHRAVLIEGHHRQRSVGIADPLQPAELARRQSLAEQNNVVLKWLELSAVAIEGLSSGSSTNFRGMAPEWRVLTCSLAGRIGAA